MKKILLLAIFCLICGIIVGLSFNASAQVSSSIPSWVKSTAKYWINGDVGDADFIKAIQWMVTHGIIVVPTTTITPLTDNTLTTSSSTDNPLHALLPTSKELGTFWKIQDATLPTVFSDISPSIPTMDRKGNVVSTYEGQPTHTIEQLFEKSSTPLTVTEFKIDIASFGPIGGLSKLDLQSTSILYSKIIADFGKNHVGYKSAPYVSPQTTGDTICHTYTSGTTQSIPQQTITHNMFCMKNTHVFMIYAQGSDVGMEDDLKTITNNILKKIN